MNDYCHAVPTSRTPVWLHSLSHSHSCEGFVQSSMSGRTPGAFCVKHRACPPWARIRNKWLVEREASKHTQILWPTIATTGLFIHQTVGTFLCPDESSKV